MPTNKSHSYNNKYNMTILGSVRNINFAKRTVLLFRKKHNFKFTLPTIYYYNEKIKRKEMNMDQSMFLKKNRDK